MKNIAFVGISGVGKSTFLRKLSAATPFLHLEASKLIKDEVALLQQRNQSSEELRKGPVLENQDLLLRAFHRRTAGVDVTVVLDGHTVVDTDNGLQRIPFSVFADLNLSSIIFLQDDPEAIRRRRASDTSRVRPERTSNQILRHQEAAMLAAAETSFQLAIPLHVVTHASGHSVLSDLLH